MRTSESKCLLCLENYATAKNSHIVPKFMTKSILGDEHAKKGYLTSTDKTHLPPVLSQDTPKEDYILCEKCEKYFSVLETYIAARVHNRLWDIRYKNDFITYEISDDVKCKICDKVDPYIFRLFIYSIIWRCDISQIQPWKSFSLDPSVTEYFRLALHQCKFEKQQELIDNLDYISNIVPNLPFTFLTAEYFGNITQNFLLAITDLKNTHKLYLNEYILIFSFSTSYIDNKLNCINGQLNDKIKVIYLTEQLWEKLITNLHDFFSSQSAIKLKIKGQKPWFM